jgi:hypothetical protein
VNRNIKEELGLLESKEPLKENQMPRTTDREELGNPLDYPESDRLKEINGTLLHGDENTKCFCTTQDGSGYDSASNQNADDVRNDELSPTQPDKICSKRSRIRAGPWQGDPNKQCHPDLTVSVDRFLNPSLGPLDGPLIDSIQPLKPLEESHPLVKEEIHNRTQDDVCDHTHKNDNPPWQVPFQDPVWNAGPKLKCGYQRNENQNQNCFHRGEIETGNSDKVSNVLPKNKPLVCQVPVVRDQVSAYIQTSRMGMICHGPQPEFSDPDL